MLVSVIVPTYNRVVRVLKAIDSVLAQTYRNIELIVVDDGSTDDTIEALSDLSVRISIIHQANAGPSAARNRGVVEAKGEIVAFLDSDDYWMPEKIERQVALMRRGGAEMCCCVCNAIVKGFTRETLGNTFDSAGIFPRFEEGEWTNPQDVLATRFLLFNQVVAIRREAFDRAGGFNEDLRLLEDYDLALRLSSFGTWGVIREPLVIKYNETIGIGVECSMNLDWHAEVCGSVIARFLESGHNLAPRARLNLERARSERQIESYAFSLLKCGGLNSIIAGRSLIYFLKVSRALRRRSPNWPKFQGDVIDIVDTYP